MRKIGRALRIIISIILLLALLAGIALIVKFGESGGKLALNEDKIVWNGGNGKADDSIKWNDAAAKKSSKLPISDNYDFEDFIGEIQITRSDEPYITVGSSKANVSVSEFSDSCKIKMRVDNVRINNALEEITVKIGLPESVRSISIGGAAQSTEISGIDIDKFECNVAAGKLIVEDCMIKSITGEIGAAEAELHTGDEIENIVLDVAAGSIDLYLPEDISGFKLKADGNIGTFNDDTGFLVKENSSGNFVDMEKEISYGDEKAKITLTFAAGEINLFSE